MKKQLLLFSIFLFISDNIFSQSFCDAPAYSPNWDLLVNTHRFADFSNYSFCVTIYIHIIRKSDGTGGQSTANVSEAMSYLNSAFNPHSIYFKWGGPINYIDNTTLYFNPGAVWSYPDNADGVDIYLFDDSVGHPIDGSGYGSTQGVGYSSKFFITGSYKGLLQYPLVRSYVIAHEMGHVFNLWHTRHGTVYESGDPNERQCTEWVNGNNGGECGDYIPDTPADPDIAFNVDYPSCDWTIVKYDEHGD